LQHRVQPWFPELDGDIGWQARERYYSWFLPRATVVIAGTEVGRKEIELFYKVPADRIKILPHPTPRFALDAPPDSGDRVLKKYGIPDKYLYYPAQFWSHKNHANLLLAARKLRDEHKLVLPVVLVGSDKGNLGYIRRLVKRLDLTSQVYFLGFVCLADLIALYRRAFALTYVTFFGPENLPPLEAFALGCPVIASNVPGAQEQLGDAALLVNPRDPDDIALAVKNLFTNQELRNVLLQRGRERALKWTARDFVKGIFSILDSFEAVRRCWGEYWGSYE
jgi:glycosyltransferase involved in cell wall biosynthesis